MRAALRCDQRAALYCPGSLRDAEVPSPTLVRDIHHPAGLASSGHPDRSRPLKTLIVSVSGICDDDASRDGIYLRPAAAGKAFRQRDSGSYVQLVCAGDQIPDVGQRECTQRSRSRDTLGREHSDAATTWAAT